MHFFLIFKIRKGKKEGKITDIGVTLIPYCCLGLSDEGNSVSRTENFMNVFNGVTSPLVFSYRYVFALFLHNASRL